MLKLRNKFKEKKIWFITGTDTNVGKTIITSLILKIGLKYGYNTIGYKPVSSGNIVRTKQKFNSDVITLKKYSSIQLKNHEINPFFFTGNEAPHILSKKQKIPIDMTIMSEKLKIIKNQSNWIVIEGAGGLYTPLSDKYTFLDWIKKEKLPIILVIGLKLGCINHAILTKNCILQENQLLFGWIANHIMPTKQDTKEYIYTLTKHLGTSPLGEIPYYSNIKKIYCKNIEINLIQQ
ncbi:dethiobiotin synthase [Buchnera aphidicola (Hormaphis cornu)]|nr:dethiobiotin synthase [Buchnera aphidicola (Hormaphis cornu)]